MTIVNFYTGKGELNAISGMLVVLKIMGARPDFPLSDGSTLQEFSAMVKQRLKEHCIANGRYNPNSPPDFNSLKIRVKKVKEKIKDPDFSYRLFNYANSEEFEELKVRLDFDKALEKIIPKNKRKESGLEEEDKEFDFIHEDRTLLVEKLINKLEEAEKPKPNDSPSSPTQPVPADSEKLQNNLEKGIKILQEQVKQLEEKVKNTTDPLQKKTYQDLLKNTEEILARDKEKKEKLSQPNEKKEPNNKDNNKLAIGLGIAAVAIFLLCLIVLLVRQPRQKH